MAETIAAAFNSQLAQRLAADDVSVPRITFLECFVYHLRETDKNGSWTYCNVLAEKRLDAALEYKKWNNNAWFVDGKSRKKRKNMLGFSGGGEGAQGGRQPWSRACVTSPPPPMPQAPQIASSPKEMREGSFGMTRRRTTRHPISWPG
jgi:hypothetical protein